MNSQNGALKAVVESPPNRFGGLDSAKGIAIGMIMLSHLNPISVTGAPPLAPAIDTLSRMFGTWLMPISVPAFLLISLLLYFQKPNLRRRMTRLLPVFGFWLVVQYGLYVALFGRIPSMDLSTLARGGPALSGLTGQPSVLYFLFDLILLIVLAELFRRVATRQPASRMRLASILLVLTNLLVFLVLELHQVRVAHWILPNFLIYIPMAWLLAQNPHRNWLGSAAVFVLLNSSELFFALTRPTASVLDVSGYARVALPFGALALVLWGMQTGPHPWLEKMGRHSLGLYAVHDTLRILWLRVLPEAHVRLGGLTVQLTIYTTVAALATTLLLVWLLYRSPLRWAVS